MNWPPVQGEPRPLTRSLRGRCTWWFFIFSDKSKRSFRSEWNSKPSSCQMWRPHVSQVLFHVARVWMACSWSHDWCACGFTGCLLSVRVSILVKLVAQTEKLSAGFVLWGTWAGVFLFTDVQQTPTDSSPDGPQLSHRVFIVQTGANGQQRTEQTFVASAAASA